MFLIAIVSVLVVRVVPFEHRDGFFDSPPSSLSVVFLQFYQCFLRRLRENDDVFESSRFAAPRKNCCCYSAPPGQVISLLRLAKEREREEDCSRNYDLPSLRQEIFSRFERR